MSNLFDYLKSMSQAKEQCIPLGICIECKQPAAPRIHTPAGEKEYTISGMCERCFDHLFGEVKWPYPYLLTGSSVYGEQHQESDVDICLNSYDADKLKLWLDEHRIEWNYLETSEEHPQYADVPTQTYYFKIGKLIINIISLLTPKDMLAWEEATQYLKRREALPKEQRKKLFRLLLESSIHGRTK